MYDKYRVQMFAAYNAAKKHFITNYSELIEIEKYVTKVVNDTTINYHTEIVSDYNEASYLNPFWSNYPPDDRGRSPVGDQVPWIEVGEHAVGHKLSRLISLSHVISEVGLPSGADNRFIFKSDEISCITNGYTDSAFVFLDIKSVGPRDNFDHTVISPYQVSGDGVWKESKNNIMNSRMSAVGRSATHLFYPAISPIYVLSNGIIAPTIHLFVKPIYEMLTLNNNGEHGQPLKCIKTICVPNGLLLTKKPGYLLEYPGLFFPGKDDKKKDPRKIRVRVSFTILEKIAPWRVQVF